MEKTPRYNISVSDRARQMLGTHIRFVANVNKEAAKKTKVEIMKAIRALATMPERYTFLDAEFIPRNKYHKVFVEKWYLILFQIKDQTVYVDYIVDCRQDYHWLMK